MRHCNSVFRAQDIWFLLDNVDEKNRKLYIAKCPICNKEMVLYSCIKNNVEPFEKYYYSGGARKIKEKFKKDITSTMLGFKTKYKMP